MPAQLTATRSGAPVPAAASTAAWTDASSATSVRANRPPVSLATRLPASSFRSAMTTVAPAAASARAVASPSPLAPPEMIAAVPFRSMPGAYLQAECRRCELWSDHEEVVRQPVGGAAGRLARVFHDPAGLDDCQHCGPEPDHQAARLAG